MRAELLDEYEDEREVEYQGEKYFVRDNGAVCRRSRPGQRRRRLDDAWTFGRPDESTGYMQLGSHVLHRIIEPSPVAEGVSLVVAAEDSEEKYVRLHRVANLPATREHVLADAE